MFSIRPDIYDEHIMLLGPVGKGEKYLKHRMKVKRELIRKNFKNIIIMEKEKNYDNNVLKDKFKQILECEKPSLFIAFFIEGEKMDGVIFELGIISGIWPNNEIRDKVRILHNNFDWSKTTAYMNNFLLNVPSAEFKDFEKCKEYERASNIIETFVRFK